MLNTIRRSLLPLTLGAIALATGACGRISILPPAPVPPPPAQFAPMPTELAAAVASARASLQGAEATLLYAAAYGVQTNGKLADSYRSGWVLGFQEKRANGVKASMVVIDWRATPRVVAAKPLPGATPPALDAAKLPPLKQTLLWGREAGLQKARSFQVAYVATPAGPVAAVGERAEEGVSEQVTDLEARDVIMLDALTGKPLAKVQDPAPDETPETAAEAGDTPEDAASLAMLALSPHRGF